MVRYNIKLKSPAFITSVSPRYTKPFNCIPKILTWAFWDSPLRTQCAHLLRGVALLEFLVRVPGHFSKWCWNKLCSRPMVLPPWKICSVKGKMKKNRLATLRTYMRD